MKRQSTVSGYKDYISIDLVEAENGKSILKENVFYFKKNEPTVILYRDREENKWVKTNVFFDGQKLTCVDDDDSSDFKGMDWVSDLEEFLDITQTKKYFK